jgi:hypothetical protein
MHAALLASVGALTVCVTLPVLAAEPNAALNLPAESYNAKWDGCETLARKKGTPPGTVGYGDFIDNCVRQAHESRVGVRR